MSIKSVRYSFDPGLSLTFDQSIDATFILVEKIIKQESALKAHKNCSIDKFALRAAYKTVKTCKPLYVVCQFCI